MRTDELRREIWQRIGRDISKADDPIVVGYMSDALRILFDTKHTDSYRWFALKRFLDLCQKSIVIKVIQWSRSMIMDYGTEITKAQRVL